MNKVTLYKYLFGKRIYIDDSKVILRVFFSYPSLPVKTHKAVEIPGLRFDRTSQEVKSTRIPFNQAAFLATIRKPLSRELV